MDSNIGGDSIRLNASIDETSIDYVGCDNEGIVSACKKLTPYEFWNKIGAPKKIVAPMVDHSDLAYRMMCRKYGMYAVLWTMLIALF